MDKSQGDFQVGQSQPEEILCNAFSGNIGKVAVDMIGHCKGGIGVLKMCPIQSQPWGKVVM